VRGRYDAERERARDQICDRSLHRFLIPWPLAAGAPLRWAFCVRPVWHTPGATTVINQTKHFNPGANLQAERRHTRA